jgi:16S rRNA (guanine966-N2)-methyltransferase
MRISGGTAKGRRTATTRLITRTASGERLRPTSSKVREALFDILRDRIEGASFVDLYAGTGTVGLEALSRGAEQAVFVEPDELRFGTIKKSTAEFGFRNRSMVIKEEALAFLKKAVEGRESFDILFIDPPYGSDEIDKVLPIIGGSGLLSEAGVVIVEHFSKKKVPETAGGLKMKKSYRYGDTMLTLYGKVGNENDSDISGHL